MMIVMNLLAVIEAGTIFQGIFYLIIIGICFWLFWWLIGYAGLPEPFAKVAKIVLALLAVFILVNFLLGLVGTPIIVWHK